MIISRKIAILAVLGGLLIIAMQTARAGAFLTDQQRRFLQASTALATGDESRYQSLKRQLRDYVLYPWLEYEEARRRLGNAEAVSSFLEKYPDTVMAQRLRRAWLHHLGKRKQWQQYLKAYRDEKDEELQCYYLDAAMRIEGLRADLVAQARQLWLIGNSRADACNGTFSHLYKHKKLSHHDYWRRYALATSRGNASLARFLEKKLTKKQKRWAAQWKKMRKTPQARLQAAIEWADTPEARDVILDGIRRYGRSDTVAAWNLWKTRFRDGFSFSDEQIDTIERKLALRAAWRHLPEAVEMLAELRPAAVNKEVREWRVRSALRSWDWKRVEQAILAMPEDERESEQWRYWRARAAEVRGRQREAEAIYQTLAEETSYYGFLAADKLGLPYRFNHEPVIGEELRHNVELLSQRPAFQRIRELREIGRETDATREWRYETAKLSRIEKRVAAQLARDWDWHFNAIVTTASARHFRDLELRFPLLYRRQIEREARRQRLPASLVYGVIRRESAYRETAESPAGALGLMQLMPGTAKLVGKKLGIKKLNRAGIKAPDTNISLGARYLREVLDRYDDNVILATASYNAGPNRVKKWLPEEAPLPADIWVDTITFDETRNYVKAVLFYSTIFDWKLDSKVDYTLRERMQPVGPKPEKRMASRGGASG